MFNVGDTVKVRDNSAQGFTSDKSRLLEPGDTVVVEFVIENWRPPELNDAWPVILYKVIDGYCKNFVDDSSYEGFNFLYQCEIEKVDDKCSCDIFVLMQSGCQCGAFQREKTKTS